MGFSEAAIGLVFISSEYQLNSGQNFIKIAIITLLIPSSIQKRAFGYPRCKLGFVGKESLSFLYSELAEGYWIVCSWPVRAFINIKLTGSVVPLLPR